MNTRREFLSTMSKALTLALAQPVAFAAADDHSPQIDAHAHVFLQTLKMAPVHRYVPHYNAPYGEFLTLLDQYHFTNGVIIQPSFLGTDNSYLLSALRHNPRRLRGVVVIDPERDIDSLEGWRSHGVKGVRLNLFGLPDPHLQSPSWQKALKKVRDLDWQVELHVEAVRLPEIAPPLLDANVKIVMDHFGRPDPTMGVHDPGFRYMLDIASSRRVWVKTSGWYRNGGPRRGAQIAFEAFPLFKKHFGLERIIWGSDWPNTEFRSQENYRSAYNFMLKLLPDAGERAIILGSTPADLYSFAHQPAESLSSSR